MAGPGPRIPRLPVGKRGTKQGVSSQDERATPSEPATGGGSSTMTAPVPVHSFNGRLISLIVVATLILFLAAPTAKIYMDQSAQISALEKTIADQERDQQRLKEAEKRWSDDAYVEQQARERMSYVMPGESSYMVLGAEGTDRQAAESSAEQVEAGRPAWADGLWQSVLDSAYPRSEPQIAPAPTPSATQR